MYELQKYTADQYMSNSCKAQRLINISTWMSYTMSHNTQQTIQS